MSGGSASKDLRALLKRLQTLRDSGRTQVSKALAVAAKALILQGFEAGTDPYGKEWAAVERAGIPLNKDGHLKGSWFVAGATASGFMIATNSPYAAVHNFGHTFERTSKKGKKYTQTVRARPMIPRGGALPKAWDDEFHEVAKAKIASILKAK